MQGCEMNTYAPLAGVKVLDLGILIPAALTSGRLAALGADVVKVEQPPRGAAYSSWANELGTLSAAMAVCAALVSVRAGGPGEWIDLSCWDALVESHRTELAMNAKTKQSFSLRNTPSQALYTTYLASDD